MGRLLGKVAVISGAGKGIGRSIARVFATEGANVLVFSRTEADLISLCSEIETAGGKAAYVVADAASEEEVAKIIEVAKQQYGRAPDIFVANAGWYPCCRLEDMTLQQWNEVLAVNLTSGFLAIKAATPGMRANGGGRVVLISSISGPETALSGYAHYAAAKAGLMGLLKTAAVELAKHKITVNAILPGNIATEALVSLPHGYVEQTVKAIPAGHLGKPADVAHAAVFLASDEAGFITGQGLVIDGGQTLPESHHSDY